MLKVLNSFEELAQEISAELAKSESPLVGLSGGSTVPPIIDALKTSESAQASRWTWIDERLVPYDADGSNYGAMIANLNEDKCIPLPCTEGGSEKDDYQKAVCPNGEMPSLELLLLGFGGDGHIASLFPGTEQLERACTEEDWIFRSEASYFPEQRWTWGMEALTNTKVTFIIFKGGDDSDKFERYNEAVNDPACSTPLARFIRKTEGKVIAYQIKG